MPPSLRFVAGLCGFSVLCGAASFVLLQRQEREQTRVTAQQLSGGNVDAGRAATSRYGCGSCHRIPDVDGADGGVGPSLQGIAVRAHLAGRLVNRPANMVLWIRRPQQVDPGNGMPDLAVTEGDARDIAAFLYTQTR